MSSRAAPRRARTGDARLRAADVLVRVETDAAFAAAVLDAALDRAPALSPADRGLTTELVYGVLRSAAALDARLARHAPRPGSIAALDPYTRAVMRIAAYQILALARIPPRAAVHSAVDALKKDRSGGLAGFANALLRKVSAERVEPLPDDAREKLAMEAMPAAIVETIARGLGSEDEARSVLRAAFSRTPATSIRVQAGVGRASREEVARRLAEERPSAVIAEGAVSPWALRISGGGELAETAAWREGLFAVQEEGAQCVALATATQPGMRVLDACAGRGGKTTALAGMMQGQGVLHAAEIHPGKIEKVREEMARLGWMTDALVLETAAVDLTRGLGALTAQVPVGGYDVVLVDAPCSGLGTIARRPDLVARLGRNVTAKPGAAVAIIDEDESIPEEVRVELPVLQLGILDRVAPLVKVGGTLVYAVCTLTREEGRDVVAKFRASHPEFIASELDASASAAANVPERLRAAELVLRPDREGTDGFMVFRLRRTASA